MKPLRLISVAEQVAQHLREEIECRALVGEMPGAKKLANRLGINHKTVDAAAHLLEKQGLLKSQGAGMPRRILESSKIQRTSLCVVILTYEPEDAQGSKIIIDLRHNLNNAGHTCTLSHKSQRELGWDMKRIERMVQETKADAWIIQAGSREILEWFSQQSFPSLALFGRFLDVSSPLAAVGVMKVPVITEAVRYLTAQGHRRIVMLSQKTDTLPTPGYVQKMFLEQLQVHDIQTGTYNLPDWESTPEGLRQVLDSLFQVTPPTALFITDILLLFPVYTHLLRRGITAPEKVSLICSDEQPQYQWCRPVIAHLRWNNQEIVRRIIEWADKTASGKPDHAQKFVNSELVTGGTIGPASSA